MRGYKGEWVMRGYEGEWVMTNLFVSLFVFVFTDILCSWRLITVHTDFRPGQLS